MDIIKNTLLVAGFSVLMPACVAVDPYADSDGDGMIDSWEQSNGLNANDPSDAALDNEPDGLTNLQEYQYRSNPNSDDSDGDGLLDGVEVNTHGTHPAKADTDDDGLDDGAELLKGTDPLVDDTDGDGLLDGAEIDWDSNPFVTDSDGDTISDGDEVNIYGSNPMSTDSDGDGLSDEDEVNTYGTSPSSADTDGDTLSDPDELAGIIVNGVTYNTSPLAADTDGDGVTDYDELYVYGTDPLDYADKPANAPVTWMYESFERQDTPEGFVLPDAVLVGWAVVDNEAASARQSLRSEATAAGQTAEVEWSAHFIAGTLKFDYRVDAEFDYDSFKVYVDGAQKYIGPKDTLIWQTLGLTMTEGPHTIKWVFQNEGFAPYGRDGAWIDNVRFAADDSEADYDNDTLPDHWEAQYALNRLNPANATLDDDGDGLTALQEYQAGTNPLVSDSDGDGPNDAAELNNYGTNPLREDSDNDGLTDVDELSGSTDPLNIDSDGDGFSDGYEATQGTSPIDASPTERPSSAETFFVSLPQGNTAEWGAFNRPDGWIRHPLGGAYTIGAAPLGSTQVIEWKRSFVAGTLSFDFTAVKKIVGYEYSVKLFIDDEEEGAVLTITRDGVETIAAEIDPGFASAIEVQWDLGNALFTIPAGEHTIRWEVQVPNPVARYDVGLYIGNIFFRGAAPAP